MGYNNNQMIVKKFVTGAVKDRVQNLKRRTEKGMKRIGLLTSGGDCQALNATMRGVVKGLSTILMI